MQTQERSLNCITSSIVTTLPEDYLLTNAFMLCLIPCDPYTILVAIKY